MVFHALNQALLHLNITVPVIVTPWLYKVSILELWLTLGPLIRGLDWGLEPIFDATINGHTLWRKKSYCKSGHPFQIYLYHATHYTIWFIRFKIYSPYDGWPDRWTPPYNYFKNSLRYELNRQQHQIEVLNSTETNQKRMEDSITRLGFGFYHKA